MVNCTKCGPPASTFDWPFGGLVCHQNPKASSPSSEEEKVPQGYETIKKTRRKTPGKQLAELVAENGADDRRQRTARGTRYARGRPRDCDLRRTTGARGRPGRLRRALRNAKAS